MILDSDVLIDHPTGQATATNLLQALLPDGAAISIITFSEMYEGIYGSRDPKTAQTSFTRFLRGVSVLPISRRVATRTAPIHLELRRQGRPLTDRALCRARPGSPLDIAEGNGKSGEIEDVEEFHHRLEKIERGDELKYRIRCRWKGETEIGRPGPCAPDLDDGIKVNICPFQEASSLAVSKVMSKW